MICAHNYSFVEKRVLTHHWKKGARSFNPISPSLVFYDGNHHRSGYVKRKESVKVKLAMAL